MKDRLFILSFFVLVSVLLPAALPKTAGAPAPAALPERFPLLLRETGETVYLSPEEYLTGCLAAQIPLDYEPAALEAQAAAAYTYALRLTADNTGEEWCLSDDTRTCQPYFTPEKCAEVYGESWEKYLPNLQSAAAYGAAHPILYNGEPICAVYHSVSAGRTCSAYGVWGREFPYLAPADSFSDKEYIYYECSNEMTAEQARVALLAADENITAPADYAKWFTEFNVNEDGYVISVKIGSNLFSGGDIWRIFGLRSTAFTVSYQNGIFTFVTKGYGHGAGLSQYGANEMAKNGATSEEILKHYYKLS